MPIISPMTISPLAQKGTVLNYEAEVKTYITGLATPLSSPQLLKLNKLVKDLKTGLSVTNLSDLFDTFYVLAGETQESSLKNLVKDAHHCQAINTPAFAAFEGFTGNGSNAYLRTNYKAGSHGVNFKQNDGSHGVYVRKELNATKASAGFSNASDNGCIMIHRKSSVGSLGMTVNNALAYDASTGVLNDRGLWVASRSSATSITTNKNTSTASTLSKNSSAVVDVEDYILCFNENGTAAFHCTNQISLRFIAKGLTTGQRDIIYNAFETYMQSVVRSVKYSELPTMAFSFDDGYVDNYTILKDVFESRNKRFTLYFTTGFNVYLTPSNKLSDAQVSELIASGHDIQCHTNSHPNLQLKSNAEIAAEFDTVNAYFAARGWQIPKHTAYPGGSFDANVKTQTALRRLSGRILYAGDGTFTETVDKYQIISNSINITKDDSAALAGIKTKMDLIASNVKIMTVYGHRVYNDADADPFTNNSIQKSYMESLLDYADTKSIRVLTMSQLYDFMQNLKVTT